MRKQSPYLVALFSLSVVATIYQAILFWHGADASENLLTALQFIFIVLIVLWVDADSKDFPNIYRPFEYGQLIFFFWLSYLPFYLWRTRRAFGLLLLLGFVLLFFLGYFAQWAIYLAR